MTPRFVRRAAAALAALAALTGCVKLKQHTKVMSDGSGRMTLTVGISKTLTSGPPGMAGPAATPEAGAKAPDPLADFPDPSKFCEGYVAASPVERTEKDGFSYASFTLWFEDVNRLRVRSPKDEGRNDSPPTTFRLERSPAGLTLRVDNGLLAETPGAGGQDEPAAEPGLPPEMLKQMEEMAKAMAAMMQQMMKGFEASETYEMPGDVLSAEGLPDRSGRTASARITDADFADPKKLEAMQRTKARTIVCGPVTPGSEDAAFRAELEAAKLDFARRVADGLAQPAPSGGAAPDGAAPKPRPKTEDAPADGTAPAETGEKPRPRVTIRKKKTE